MECYLKLGPDVDYSDFYLCLLLPNWLALPPNLNTTEQRYNE